MRRHPSERPPVLRYQRPDRRDGLTYEPVSPGPFLERAPVHSLRLVVPPGASSSPGDHHDTEIWSVLSGSGEVVVDGVRHPVAAGDLVHHPPLARHLVVNTSGTDDLVVHATWWEDMDHLFDEHQRRLARQRERSPGTRVVVPAIVTPNGELHLGHLAGPYIAADVFARALRLAGGEAHTLLGTLGHEDHVEIAAGRLGLDPYESAERFTERIIETFRVLGVQSSVFLRATPTRHYLDLMQDFYRDLRAKGMVVERERLVHVRPSTGQPCHQAEVTGACPYCGARASGNYCEGCGRFHDDHELTEAADARTGERTELRPTRGLYFTLEAVRPHLERLFENGDFPEQVHAYASWSLAGTLPDVPISRQSRYGVPIPEPGFEDQRMAITFEHAGRYLTGVQQLTERLGYPGDWRSFLRERDVGLTVLFGCDNAFVRIVLTPGLLAAHLGDDWLPTGIVMNHFYLLDGAKFSTGARHAIWARDLARAASPDSVRLYVSQNRPEVGETDFRWQDMARFAAETPLGEWQGWLRAVQGRVDRLHDGVAPEAGPWSAADYELYDEVVTFERAMGWHYREADFSPAGAMRWLMQLARAARHFHDQVSPWPAICALTASARTHTALELLAVRSFAHRLAPIAPETAAGLGRALGLERLTEERWPATPRWVPPGTRVAGLDEVLPRTVRVDAAAPAPGEDS